jgi:hypothetical protein
MANLQTTTVDGDILFLRTDNITTSSKSLVLTDVNGVVTCTNTTAITITVPNDTTTNFPIGSCICIYRGGSGAVTLAAAAGVTVYRVGNLEANEELEIRKRAANTWIVINQQGRSGVLNI